MTIPRTLRLALAAPLAAGLLAGCGDGTDVPLAQAQPIVLPPAKAEPAVKARPKAGSKSRRRDDPGSRGAADPNVTR